MRSPWWSSSQNFMWINQYLFINWEHFYYFKNLSKDHTCDIISTFKIITNFNANIHYSQPKRLDTFNLEFSWKSSSSSSFHRLYSHKHLHTINFLRFTELMHFYYDFLLFFFFFLESNHVFKFIIDLCMKIDKISLFLWIVYTLV